MKAILLTCNAAHGQNAAALAVKAVLEKRGAVCEIRDALALLGETVSDAVAAAFVNTAVKTPRAFAFLYAAEGFAASGKPKSPVYFANALYAENLRRYLLENEFDAAICLNLFAAEAVTFLRRQHKLAIKSYFISTDYLCVPFLEEAEVDCIVTAHADLAGQFTRRGILAGLLEADGIPVLGAYAHAFAKADARATLDLPLDTPCYLIVTGGEGCCDALTLTAKLLERLKARDARIVTLTGRNARLAESIRTRFGGDVRVSVLPLTERVPLYMDACDVLIARPGGISSTEAAIKGVPMIHTPPLSGVEAQNAQFFAERGMSIAAANEDSAADNALRLAADEAQRERMLAAQRQYLSPGAASRIAARVLGLDPEAPEESADAEQPEAREGEPC